MKLLGSLGILAFVGGVLLGMGAGMPFGRAGLFGVCLGAPFILVCNLREWRTALGVLDGLILIVEGVMIRAVFPDLEARLVWAEGCSFAAALLAVVFVVRRGSARETGRGFR